MSTNDPSPAYTEVAIIGMNGRFPGANTLEEYWKNLCAGVESVCTFTNPTINGDRPITGGRMEGPELFDASFFGFNPREAEVMDPQHRIMLECAWAALESAGYDPQSYPGSIGVFVGASPGWYGIRLFSNPEVARTLGQMQVMVGTDSHFLASRVSYKLNLRGPSLSVKAACSTSLVTVHLACQSLLHGECDMALAGGVGLPMISFSVADWQSISSEDGGILSASGHCRAFDADAQGTVPGDGVGVVVLKRLEDALRDGDCIQAVIKGSALNNDGSMKIGYTAPSMEGQAKVISEAMAVSGVAPESITYVEAHGTGTPLGDPIEIAALTQAFRANGINGKKNFCGIGSVKTNVGHLDGAAGVAGLIKTVLAVKHGRIPPSLHFKKPNPNIDFENSPFYVNSELREWKTNGWPRRAGVNAFGFGGTNVHIVVEEPPVQEPLPHSRANNLWILSARTKAGLERATVNLLSYLEANPDLDLADATYTLQVGRRHFAHRRAFSSRSREEAIETLRSFAGQRPGGSLRDLQPRPVQFLFPGQGAQYVNMGRELYETEPGFREHVDRCCRILEPELGFDLRTLLYPAAEAAGEAQQQLNQTANTQPALFVVEYALAQLWMEWGVRPAAMVGHSIGEYVAATIAGVFSLEDALRVVAARGRLMQALPPGSMLAVPLGETEILARIHTEISLAAISGPTACVVAGTHEAVQQLKQRLATEGIESRPLATSHAFHSHMMEPALEAFADVLKAVRLNAPQLPYISNLSGNWIAAEEATDVRYWVRQLRDAVRIGDGIATLAMEPQAVMLEVGPGRTLSSLIRHNLRNAGERVTVTSLRHPGEQRSDQEFILNALGKVWVAGVAVDWQGFHRHEKRYRMPLPTYPFDRQRYWVDFVTTRRTDVILQKTSAQDVAGEETEEASRPPLLSLHGRPDLDVDFVAPRTAMEKRIGELWSEVLGIEGIGVQDNFFDLGGHSLAAIQLIARLRSGFGLEVAPEVFFDYPTIEGFAAEMEAKVAAAGGGERPISAVAAKTAMAPLQRQERPVPLPLSYAQQRLWFIDQLQGSSTEYNLPSAYHLRGELDLAALQRALNTTVERHEVLRSRFITVDNLPAQVVDPARPIDLHLEDLSGLDPAARNERLQAALRQEWKQPFDLEHGPLMRVRLLKLEANHHVLLRTLHHIISDGWSEGVLNEELTRLYTAFHKGQENPLAPLDLQYVDFTLWQRKWLNEEVQSGELAYWREQLAGIPEQLELAKDRSRGVVQTFAAAMYHCKMSSESAARVKRFAQSSQSTLYMTLLAAFGVLLQRYSGQDDIVVGSPMANRQDPQLEKLIGFFINTLVMRVRPKKDQTFQELLSAVRSTTLAAYSHQNLPFERLVEILSPQRSLNTTPIFQVLFVLQNSPVNELQPEGLKMVPFAGAELPADELQVGFDIELNAWELDGTIQFYWMYNRDLFDGWRIEQMARHYVRLLEAIVAAPGQAVGQLEMMGLEDRELLASRNRTERRYAGGELVHEMFERQAAERPQATAVIFEGHAVSYGELNGMANRVARELVGKGVGAEELVGVYMERSVEMVVGLLGVMKAGGAYVPLEPEYPGERLEWMMEEAGMKVVVTQKKLKGLVPMGGKGAGKGVEVVVVDVEKGAGAGYEDNVRAGVGAENLAYVIYTSGSTGKPKGAMNTHGAIRNRLLWMQEEYGLVVGERVVQKTPFTFDVSVWEFFWPLMTGASLVVARPGGHRDGEYLVRLIEEEKISTLHFVPSMLGAFLQVAGEGRCGGMKRVICSGEALPVEMAEEFLRRYGAELHNLYGPTEAAVDVTYRECKRGYKGATVPIGKPIANLQMHVLDEEMGVVPVGVAGEIYIGGEGLGRGYVKRPEWTAERFVPNPMGEREGERLYRTGDKGRYLADGEIEFLGRLDYQVKIRGLRIELGEIEAVLGQYGGVSGAAVVAWGEGEKRLVGYYGVKSGEEVEEKGLREYLKGKLPEYMVPVQMVKMGEMPLTSSGKIDRRALPAPEQPLSGRTHVAPRNAVEELLAEIWAELLSVEKVGIEDNFFNLGGHSILAVSLLARIKDAMKCNLTLQKIFESPTIGELAPLAVQSTPRPDQAEKLASLVLRVRRMTPEERKQQLARLKEEKKPQSR